MKAETDRRQQPRDINVRFDDAGNVAEAWCIAVKGQEWSAVKFLADHLARLQSPGKYHADLNIDNDGECCWITSYADSEDGEFVGCFVVEIDGVMITLRNE